MSLAVSWELRFTESQLLNLSCIIRLQIPKILIVIVCMILFISTCKRDNIVQGWSFRVSIWKSSIAGSLPAPRLARARSLFRPLLPSSPLACLPRARPFSLSPATSKRLLRRLHPGVLLARHVGPKNVYVRGYIAGKASLNTVKVRADQPFKPQYQHTNSPVWSPYWRYISLRNWLREFDKRSKHFPFGNYYINSHNPSSLWCADIIRRKLMLITLAGGDR